VDLRLSTIAHVVDESDLFPEILDEAALAIEEHSEPSGPFLCQNGCGRRERGERDRAHGELTEMSHGLDDELRAEATGCLQKDAGYAVNRLTSTPYFRTL